MSELKPAYDVVVIGSGFGGAITAARRAEAGRSVCILEKGRWWDKTDFPRSPADVRDGAIRTGNETRGFIEYHVFPRMDVVQGCGVGGGSLHYFNVARRPPATIFDDPRWPASITLEALEPYYERARLVLGARALDPLPIGRDLPPRTKAFEDAVRASGHSSELVDIAVYTRPESNDLGQDACVYCGNCLFGCHLHAKNTLDLNYIRIAQRHGADVAALHKAERIEPHGSGYRVTAVRLGDPARLSIKDEVSIQAGQVVVAAGTLGSNELLLKCRDKYRTLPQLSPMLGRGYSGNGDMLFAGTLYRDKTVDPGKGPSITAGVRYDDDGHQILIEDLGYPGELLWYLNGTLPTLPRLWHFLRLKVQYAMASLQRKGAYPRQVELDAIFRGGATLGFLPYLGMGTDAADGVLSLARGGEGIWLDWKHRASRSMFDRMERRLKQLSRDSGGVYVRSFLWKWPFRKLLTAHPLGGCNLSERADQGVVDPTGQVWKYPNLFVADGSIIPTALAANPSATISALAERIAEYMAGTA